VSLVPPTVGSGEIEGSQNYVSAPSPPTTRLLTVFSVFSQLLDAIKTGHCLTSQYLAWTTRRPDASCWWCQYSIQSREHLLKNCPQWRSQQKTLWTTPTRGKDRTSIAELLADEQCGRAVLDFLANTDVDRTSGPPVAGEEDEAANEASEWEAREQAERDWERMEEEVRLGAEL